MPETWDVSLLALLAQVDWPEKPGDLRPIAMSSCMQKCLNKLAMGRVFPVIRRPSRCSSCGSGRQAADIIGCVTRLRFDKVRRSAVADLLQKRTRDGGVDMETRWLLRQLAVNKLKGVVPGGHPVEILCKALKPKP